jgi:hypothetical protein
MLVPAALAGHLFAYGSRARDVAGRPALLRGVRRAWGVAMDNCHVIPGYKIWLDPADDSRPAIHVAFLDLAPAPPGAAVLGVLIPVSRRGLACADARERNYERIDVSERFDDVEGPVWAYFGSAAGRARYRCGVAAGTTVVAHPYLQAVRSAFSRAAIPAPPVPVRRLVRRDVPPPA